MPDTATIILVSQMSAVAYYSILVWDWIISLTREYRLIWNTDWTLYKILYIVNRYWTLLALAFSLWAYTAKVDGATCAKVVNLIVSHFISSLMRYLLADGFSVLVRMPAACVSEESLQSDSGEHTPANL